MNENLTHAYAHLLADMQLAVFAPAFTFSLCESEAPASRRMHIAFFVRPHLKETQHAYTFHRHPKSLRTLAYRTTLLGLFLGCHFRQSHKFCISHARKVDKQNGA